MTTLESIVESLKFQLKPHMTDDVRLYDEFIIRMIHDTRAAIIKAQYVSNDPLTAYYQTATLLAEDMTYDNKILRTKLPSKLMADVGYKNIRSIEIDGKQFTGREFHYTGYEEFIMYGYHVYGNDYLSVANEGEELLLRGGIINQKYPVKIRGIFEYPDELTGYGYEESEYPIASADLRQLEIVTFQHIAVKLGMPADVINNGYDETRNAQIPQTGQRQQQRQEDENEEQ